jgi:hypothetical protein
MGPGEIHMQQTFELPMTGTAWVLVSTSFAEGLLFCALASGASATVRLIIMTIAANTITLLINLFFM